MDHSSEILGRESGGVITMSLQDPRVKKEKEDKFLKLAPG